ncbi:MAG: BamA/TamA family outer membrane protein [Flavobacteriales bacterium]
MRSFTRHIPLLLALVVLSGCDPTRRLADGEHLLKKNRIEVTESSVDPYELSSILKQKPNKRILGVPFYLTLYNLRDPEAVRLKRLRKDSVCVASNEERALKGKRTRTCDHATRQRNGEPPVVLDTTLIDRSTDQLRLYMRKEGYFDANVSDTIHYLRRSWFSSTRKRPYSQPKAEVAYLIEPGPKYTYRNISFTVDDPTIQLYVQAAMGESLLAAGDRFDADVLDAERTRITDRLKELGYLYFTKDLVMYDADTKVGDHQVDIIMRLERPYSRTDRGLKGTPEARIYTIQDVTIRTHRGLQNTSSDTTLFQGYRILHTGPLSYKPKALLSHVFLKPDQRFQLSMSDNTYRRLTSLRVFDRVEISYDTLDVQRPGLANARIGLLPGKPQSVTAELYGTNRGGFLGTTLSFGYRHRNLFRSLGYLQFQLNMGLEAQQSFTTSGGTTGPAIGNNTFFNTVNIGPEITFGFPRPFSSLFSKSSGSHLLVNGLYNFQRRPDFTRTLAKARIGMEWNESEFNRISVFPLDLNVIKIPSKSPEFSDYLIQSNDPVLIDSYTDHLIIGPSVQFTRNTQSRTAKRNVFFLRLTGEWAPSLAWLGTPVTDSLDNEYYTVAGIRYAEFVKVDSDMRWRHIIHAKSSLAFRFAAGLGVPYGNLNVLPFEISFFGGGANGMRAWRARSLGPGSYSAPLVAYDRIGEIRIEGNAEYRFKLIGYLEGALFADVGNIWNRQPDPRRPGADFRVDEFIGELAVGTGVGARLNFDFFIVRFDLGMQTKDPSLPKGERWLFQPKDEYESQLSELTGGQARYTTQFNFNLGIGYPF